MPQIANDVTVLILSVGEPTLDRCLAAVDRQTTKPASISIVRDRTPFHVAFNYGVAQITTPYFLQCDADMVLDQDCLETLRAAIQPDVVVAAAYLRDPLLGVIQAVKLFRTEPLRQQPNPDSISSETDSVAALLREGWKTQFVRRSRSVEGKEDDVLGDHLPPYDDQLYTFGKFRTLGSLVRHRGNGRELEGCLNALRQSSHPAANLALIAFCRGLFEQRSNDLHQPARHSEEFGLTIRLLSGDDPATLGFATTRLEGFFPDEHMTALLEPKES